MTPKRKNPTDATLRNVRAAAKRLTAVERHLARLDRLLRWIQQQIAKKTR